MYFSKNFLGIMVAGLLTLHSQSCECESPNFELKINVLSQEFVNYSATAGASILAGYLCYKCYPYIQEYFRPSTKIASIHFDQPIRDVDDLVQKLLYVKETDALDALLLIIDSGGGAPGKSELLFHLVDRIAAKKPVVVLIIDSCASGAYLMASSATAIVALGMSSVGCIGVTGSRARIFPEKFDDEGTSGTIEVHPFSSGKYKSLQNEYVPLTDEAKERVQYEMDAIYDVFVNLVAYARGLKVEEKEIWADGKVFTGWEARQLGLVDEVGDIDTALSILKAELTADGKSVDNIRYVHM